MEFKGKAHKFGDDINTDYIMSSRHRTQTLDYVKLAEHLMEDIRPGFFSQVRAGILSWPGRISAVAHPASMRLGSSGGRDCRCHCQILCAHLLPERHQSGLPLIECDTDQINEGDTLRVDLLAGKWSTRHSAAVSRLPRCPSS